MSLEEEKLEERLEKVVDRLVTAEKQIKKIAETIQIMDSRLKHIGVIRDINYSG